MFAVILAPHLAGNYFSITTISIFYKVVMIATWVKLHKKHQLYDRIAPFKSTKNIARTR